MSSKTLCTFSGKMGDILWSLPTVRELSKRHGEAVDFGIMPQYSGLLELLNFQSYISKAEVFPDWICTGSPHGDQPWKPPAKYEIWYEHIYHLTYRAHPGIGAVALPLCDFIASQQKVELHVPVVPFLEAQDIEVFPPPPQPVLPYGFNGDYADAKQQFLCKLLLNTQGQLAWVDVTNMPFMQAAAVIKKAGIYVGCRSACWVLATGLGAQTITFEPNPNRHAWGRFGDVFSCPYGREQPVRFNASPQESADLVTDKVLQWRDAHYEREKWDGRTVDIA